jgi:branched-chain amino acid transport system substrate-binding protein
MRMIKAVAGFVAISVFMAFGTVWAAEGPIVLGAHAPQTGALGKHGTEQIKGTRLAVQDFENRTGIKVELKVYDDESDPQKAVAAVEKLAGMDKVNGIVDGYGSGLVGPASEAAERYDTPYLTTGAVGMNLSSRKLKNFFRLNYMPGYAAAQSGAIKDILKAKKAGIFYNSEASTAEIAEEVKEQLIKAGLEVPVFEGFEKGTTNFKPLLLKLKDNGCDALIVEGYFPDYVGTIKDARVLRLPLKAYIGAWGIGTPEFIEQLGPMSEYVYGTSVWEVGTAPKETQKEEADIVSAYVAKYNETPSYIAMLGYLSTEYMLEAIQTGAQSGQYNPDKTRAALRSMDRMSPMGRIGFDEKGDPKYFTAVLFQTRNGKQVVVYPENRASGQAVYPAVPWAEK